MPDTLATHSAVTARKEKTMPKHILVINDTAEILELFREILHGEAGYEVTISSFQPEIMTEILASKPDLIISDHVFGEEKIGWQFIQKLKMVRETADIPVIVCSGAVKELKEMEGYLTAKNIGILFKPFDVDELLDLVERKLLDADDPATHTSTPGEGITNKNNPANNRGD